MRSPGNPATKIGDMAVPSSTFYKDISFRHKSDFTTLTIKCQDGILYGDARMISRVSPGLRDKMTRGSPVRTLELSDERMTTVESFLRTLDYFIDNHGIKGASEHALEEGDVDLPITDGERIPFVDFCLRFGVPEFVDQILESPKGIKQTIALIGLVLIHKNLIKDSEDKLFYLEDSLVHEFMKGSSEMDLSVCNFIWKSVTSKSYHPGSEEMKRGNAFSSQRRFLEQFQKMGYRLTDLGEHGDFLLPEIKEIISQP